MKLEFDAALLVDLRMRECERRGEAPAYQRFEDWRPNTLGLPFPSSGAAPVAG